jgi:gamma-glutamyltranspeptidase/glutathione hydrolase
MNGMVVAPQPVAAEEGVLALRRGGNAVDAAVTAALVQGVVDPLNCGIGGLGGMQVYRAEHDEQVFVDFFSSVGSKATPDVWADQIVGPAPDGVGFILQGDLNEIGYSSIGTPGTVLALSEALKRYGTWSWEEALAPAISWTRKGYPIPAELARDWRMPYAEGRPNARARFNCTPAAAAIYTRGGELLEEGDVLVNEDLARSLERLAGEGPETFYRGSMATEIAADLEAHGALVTGEDLENYQVGITAPLQGTYRGYTVAAAPPPFGGITLLQILRILEEYDLGAMGLNSAAYIRVVSQAIKAGFADRNLHVGDPAFVDVPVERLLSGENARQWKERIDRGEPIDTAFDRTRKEGGTTQMSVVDGAGNCVSLTHTCGLCSGVVTPGLGFLYNNYMVGFDPVPGGPNSIAPGKKRVTGSAPTLLFKEGKPFMVVGAPGGTRIVSAVLQTILNVVDHGLSALEAVAAPRVDCQSGAVYIEGKVPRWVCEELEKSGLEVARDTASYGPYPARAARVHAIVVDGERLDGGADPRGYGVALSA